MVRYSRAIIILAAAALVSGCTVKKTEQPPLTGPSELALSINLTANPDILPQDGSSQSRIVILARDANSIPVKALPLHVGMTVTATACDVTPQPSGCEEALEIAKKGQLSATDVTTGSDGRATITYTAPPLPNDANNLGVTITVGVTPTGTDFANALSRTVNIGLIPPGTVTPAPIAAFIYTPDSPAVNSTVTFDASGSTSTGTIVTYSWDFGDYSTGTGAYPQHTYRSAGSYDVVLTVSDSNNRTSNKCTRTLTVIAASAPTASFTTLPAAPLVGQTVFFDASASTPGTGRRITDYAWDFGNGTTAHGLTVTTSFSQARQYTVQLTVTDDIGQTRTKASTVTVGTAQPTASFTSAAGVNDTANNRVIISFDSSASRAVTGLAITEFAWNFGDGSTPETTTSTMWPHAFANPGAGQTRYYNVTLTVTDSGGNTGTIVKTVSVTGF